MLRELLECLGDVGDPRDPAKVEHRLVDVLAIAVCAVLAYAESFEDIALYGRSKRGWLEHVLELPNGIPSHDTFRRVLMLIDPEQFERAFWPGLDGPSYPATVLKAPPRSPWTARRCAAPSTAGGAGRRCIWSVPSPPRAVWFWRSAGRPTRAASPRC